jgi:nitrate reductase delta subunit
MGTYAILAEGLRYPTPGQLMSLKGNIGQLALDTVKTAYSQFIERIENLSLAAWEELHTRTLDLNPPGAPYIGYQTWGDSYQRGAFMSMMNRAIDVNHIDSEGELPDHLIPVLRLMDQLAEPFPELEEVLAPAVSRIHAALVKVDPENPYVWLIAAILEASSSVSRTPAADLNKN